MKTTSSVTTKRRLGEILIDQGVLTDEQLQRALAAQRETGKRLGEVLLEDETVEPTALLRALAVQYDLDFIDLETVAVDLELVQRVPSHIARRHRAAPALTRDGEVVVAMANPLDVIAIDDLRNLLGERIRPAMADPAQILELIERGSAADSRVHEILRAAADEARPVDEATDVVSSDSGGAPLTRFVDLLLTKAIQERASDVHVEPRQDGLRIRFRVDGVLHDALDPPRSLAAGLLSRIKVMADLDIAERRLPQDGRTSVTVGDERVDVRVATVPTVHGESATLRILRPEQGLAAIDGVDLLPDQIEHLRTALARSWGMVLVTGPTGSGKTTTLYAALQQLNEPGRSIVTVEDPVEYRLDGLKQVQVNKKAELTFARALRSFLRIDPDVMLVGEIRDPETARIAVESSLTGHLVLSSLHTNSAAAAPVRLLEMGVEPYLISASVLAVTAQRLVRRVCPGCARPEVLDPARVAAIGFATDMIDDDGTVTVRRGTGCARCGGSGYLGRLAIHEVMPWSETIGDLVVRHAPIAEIHGTATAAGMTTLRQAGLHRVADGLTTPEEILAVS